MTQAARGSGRLRQQDRVRQQKQSDSRDSDAHPARRSPNFYEPLPLGADAFLPPLAPAAEPQTSTLRKVALWCALGALAGASAGGIVLAFVLERESPATAAIGRVAVRESRQQVAASEPAKPRKTPRAVAAVADPAARPQAGKDGEPDAPQPPAAEAAGDTAEAEPAAAKRPAEPEPASGSRAAAHSVESERTSSSTRPRKSAPLPEKPSRAQVLSAMARVQPAVKACLPGGRGMVTADLTILGSTGRVTSAQISGQVGTVGSCAARAVRKAKFPKFASESITVRYPMAF